ncbi:MAG: flagellar biosynthesis protein FliQ [Phycisphaerae bacterium]|nr:flagellar biosynthesis protein FliQ [Phycisphaerae bacterium]
MDPDMALDVSRQMMMLALKVSFPILCVGLAVGVLISILQAVTQIQEMTLTFVPKVIAMVLAGILLMPWALQQLMAFAQEMLGPMPIP